MTTVPSPIRSRRARLAGITLVLLAAMAIPASAAPTPASCAPTRHDTRLASMISVVSNIPAGTAGISEDASCGQLFGVTVVADIPDGDEIVIVASTKAGPALIESAMMFGGIGQLVIAESASSTTSSWVSDIKLVEVYRYIVPRGTRGRVPTLILRGKF